MKRRALHPKRAGPAANFAWGWSKIVCALTRPVTLSGQNVEWWKGMASEGGPPV